MSGSTVTDSWCRDLAAVARPEKVRILSSFFKTGKGEYGYGDRFIGVAVPDNRAIAIRHATHASMTDVAEMLAAPIHEYRLSGLLALVRRYAKAKSEAEQLEIKDFYMAHLHRANNWDLVDLSAPYILGKWIASHPEPELMERLSRSDNLWEQRTAIVSTYTLIKSGETDLTIELAVRYLTHTHPLIHKATGWMLREVGKRQPDILTGFLDRYAPVMPRTMLRYAIERLAPAARKIYMAAKR